MDKALAVDIWNQPGDEAYPIAAFTYIIVYKDLGYLKDAGEGQGAGRLPELGDERTARRWPAQMDYAPLAERRAGEGGGRRSARLTWSGRPVASAQVDARESSR